MMKLIEHFWPYLESNPVLRKIYGRAPQLFTRFLPLATRVKLQADASADLETTGPSKARGDLPVEVVGSSWQSPEAMPIAILFGFNPWKRQFVSSYLKEFKCAFVRKASFRRVRRDFMDHFAPSQEFVFIFWGHKLPLEARIYLKYREVTGKKSCRTYKLEDGFLRSMGTGLLHTRPCSLCIDDEGIYFDSSRPSAIETTIARLSLAEQSGLQARAEAGISLMKAARVTKYYNTRPYRTASGADAPPKKTGRYTILVIGQVEDDASVALSRSSAKTNADLVRRARRDFPQADIYFRPHPDLWHGLRKGGRTPAWLAETCAIVPPDTSVYDAFEIVDHVYTISSLTGLEALLYGLKVTTLGAPFYSGWGLTEDQTATPRRSRKLTTTELFAASYLLYPRYLHPESDEATEFEDIVSHFVVEVLKYEDTFRLQEHPLFQACLDHKDVLSRPFRLLAHLQASGGPGDANDPKTIDLAVRDLRLREFPQTSFLLAKTANYDALIAYLNAAIAEFSRLADTMSANSTLLESFLYNLSIALRQTNGRVTDRLPDINQVILNLPGNDRLRSRIFRHYVACLASTLQYDIIDEFIETAVRESSLSDTDWSRTLAPTVTDIIENSMRFHLEATHYKAIAAALKEKPARSERNSAKRHRLLCRVADLYGEALNARHDSVLDRHLNQMLRLLLRDANQAMREDVETLLHLCNWSMVPPQAPDQAEAPDRNPNQPAADGPSSVYKPSWIVREFLAARGSEIMTLCEALQKQGDTQSLDDILAFLEAVGLGRLLNRLKLARLRAAGEKKEFLNLYRRLAGEKAEHEKLATLYARSLREWSQFAESEQEYRRLARSSKTLARRVRLEEETMKVAFCRRTSEILNSVPQPGLPKGVIFIASQTCFNTLAMMVPALVELKKRGYAVVNLVAGMTEHQQVGLDYIDRFAGAIPLDLVTSGWQCSWRVDWDSKQVEALGINFYQGFYERLSTASRRYFVDLSDAQQRSNFMGQLQRSDTCLRVCEDIRASVLSRGLACSFVTGNSHVTPYSIFRDFARHHDHPRLNFINCSVAYESYFTNLGSKFANTMCVTDMTLHPLIRAPFLARKDQFEDWYARNSSDNELAVKAESLINVNRVGSVDSQSDAALLQELESAKRAGKRIICAFGKVPVDLNVPFDGGPAHSDMADWLNHTIQVCGRNDDILLLVKPHPHELRPEIALDLVEGLHHLVEVDVPKNVRLLGHRDINVHALAPYLELAILYNGSSALELTAMGVPVMMTSHFGKHDYPIDLLYPQSREHYEQFLMSGAFPAPEQDLRKKAAYLICYLGSDEISIVNRYSIRQITNDKIGIPRWREEYVGTFVEHGDRLMALIAKRIVEKFEH